jgi:hypothetical protein
LDADIKREIEGEKKGWNVCQMWDLVCVGEDPLIFLSLGLKSALYKKGFVSVFPQLFSLEDVLQA